MPASCRRPQVWRLGALLIRADDAVVFQKLTAAHPLTRIQRADEGVAASQRVAGHRANGVQDVAGRFQAAQRRMAQRAKQGALLFGREFAARLARST